MPKQLYALTAALIVPYLIFSLVVVLNKHDVKEDKALGKAVNFDVTKAQHIEQPKPKPKPKPKPRRTNQPLPAIKPANLSGSLSGSGLSFGVPLFDEAQFADVADNGLLDSIASGPMDKDSVDTPPRVLSRSPIVYPERARKQGVSGYVAMNVLINESGNVEDVDIVESKPDDVFDSMADSTIRRWRFEPATYNGKKVKVWALQKVVFKLD